MENRAQVFHAFHSSLGISQAQRDSHIPTATAITFLSPTQNQNSRKEVGRCAASSSSFHDHSALESKTAFMIILGLENAPFPAPRSGSIGPDQMLTENK